ncbi:MAG: hypothetical protein ACTMIV_06725, partial [Brevibacterium aurantiacum]
AAGTGNLDIRSGIWEFSQVGSSFGASSTHHLRANSKSLLCPEAIVRGNTTATILAGVSDIGQTSAPVCRRQ